jgi:gliding motility-associated-like protein
MLPNTSNEGITGTWNPGMLSTANAGTLLHLFTPDANQCAAPYTLSVVINPVPENVDAGPGFTINTGNVITLQGSASGTGNTYTWTPSLGLSNTNILTPQANPDNTTTYYLEVENSFGCTAKDSTIIVVNEECMSPMKIFTPNNDGFYDKWIVYTGGCVKSVQANVYNRYGGLVYHSDNYQNDWNGTFKGNVLPDATYYYVLIVVDSNNKKYTKKGSVTIMR